jgi:hypothetical protein
MATAAHRRTIHVHDAEVSTEQDSLWDYAEALVWLVAIIALVASVWLTARPRQDADIAYPDTTSSVASGQFTLAPTGEAYQADPSGPGEVAVFTPDAAAPAATPAPTFGAPFG